MTTILNRLLHRVEIINMNDDSYKMKNRKTTFLANCSDKIIKNCSILLEHSLKSYFLISTSTTSRHLFKQ